MQVFRQGLYHAIGQYLYDYLVVFVLLIGKSLYVLLCVVDRDSEGTHKVLSVCLFGTDEIS